MNLKAGLVRLVLLFLPLQASADSFMSEYMYRLLSEGVQLRKPAVPVTPTGVVGIARDSRTGAILGSLSRLCPTAFAGADSSRSYYLTNFHVASATTALTNTASENLRKEFLDSAMDIALFSGPNRGEPCATLARQLRLPMIFDADAAGNTSLRNVLIEAYDVETQGLSAREMATVLGSSVYGGLPGYHATGPVLMANARSLRGMSGGAIFGRISENELETNGREIYWSVDLRTGAVTTPSLLMLGLIQGVDSEGRRTVALPSPFLFQRLQLYFSSPGRFGDVLSSRLEDGAVVYPDSRARYYRGDSLAASHYVARTDSGLAALQTAGTGRGTDGGTGRGTDGGRNGTGPSKSGLVFDDQPDRTWLSLTIPGSERRWAEYEPLHPDSVRALVPALKRDGVFEQQGALFASTPETPFPLFLLNETNSNHDEFLLDTNGTLKVFSRPELRNCRVFASLARRTKHESSGGAAVFVCDKESAGGHRLMMSVFPLSRSAPSFTVLVELRKNCTPGARPCAVSDQARVVRHSNAYGAWEGQENSLLWYQQWLSGLDLRSGEPLRRDGLRHFENDSTEILLERLGGFRIRIGSETDGTVFTGPVGDVLARVDPDLDSPTRAYQEVLSQMNFKPQTASTPGKPRKK